MGIVIRQGFRNTVVTYIGVIIGAVNLLYIFPKLLKPEEIGLTRVLVDVAIIMASFAQLGAGALTDKFFPFFRDESQKHRGFLGFLLLYPLIGFAFVCAAFLFFKDFWISSYQSKSVLLVDYYYHIIPLTFFVLYQQLVEAYCRVHYKIVVPGFVREVYLRLFVTLIVLLYFFKVIDLNYLIILLLISYASAVVILLFYIKFLKKLFLHSFKILADKALKKEMVTFSLFVFLVGGFPLIANRFDVLFLSSINGLVYTGIYSIAYYIATIIEIPRRSISQISSPLIAQSWKNNDLKSMEDLYKKSSLNQLIIGFTLFLMIWCNVDFVLALLPNTEVYKAGKYVIFFIGISKVVDMGMGVNGEIISNSPYYRFNFFLSIFSGVFVIASNYFLIHWYGMNGAAISTLLNIVLLNIIRCFYIHIKVKIHPFSKEIYKVLIIGLVTFCIIYFLPVIEGSIYMLLLNIILRGVVVLLVFIGLIYYLKISNDFNNIINKGLTSIGIK